MKKTAALLASAAAVCVCSMSAFAADGTTGGNGNIIDGVLEGAEDIVDGVVSGAEDIITPGGSTSVDDNTSDNMSMPGTTSQVTPGDSTSNAGNVNTGAPAFELAALGAAALGGLTTMAITIRKNNK